MKNMCPIFKNLECNFRTYILLKTFVSERLMLLKSNFSKYRKKNESIEVGYRNCKEISSNAIMFLSLTFRLSFEYWQKGKTQNDKLSISYDYVFILSGIKLKYHFRFRRMINLEDMDQLYYKYFCSDIKKNRLAFNVESMLRMNHFNGHNYIPQNHFNNYSFVKVNHKNL